MLKSLSGILTTVLSGWILLDRLLHRLRSWSWHFLNSDISQGSVVTQLRCGEISQGFVANLLVNLSVKEVWRSVNIWRSYGQYCSALFFWLSVYACSEVMLYNSITNILLTTWWQFGVMVMRWSWSTMLTYTQPGYYWDGLPCLGLTPRGGTLFQYVSSHLGQLSLLPSMAW